MIVVPEGNRVPLEQGGVVPRAIVAEIVRPVSTLDDAIRLVFGEDAFV
jgi:hypothetical protein